MGWLSLPIVPMEGEGFNTPGVDDFIFDGGFIPGVDWVNKPLVQALISAALIIVFWVLASRKLKVIPSKGQFFNEYAYNFIRNGVARDALGHDFRPYLPYLLGLFSFVLVNNLFGLVPIFMFPTFSNIGYAWGLAGLTWIIYNVAGFRRHGLKYVRNTVMPAGVPVWLLPIIIPIEFLSNIIIRPLTLALRLFGNLFAGHVVVMVFVTGGAYLLLQGENLLHNFTGAVALVFSFAIFALELLVSALQAYIFVVLTAQYVGSSLAEEH